MSAFKVYPVAASYAHRTKEAYRPIKAHAPLKSCLQGWLRIYAPVHVVTSGVVETVTSPVRALVGNSVLRGLDGDKNYSGGAIPSVARGVTSATAFVGKGIGTGLGFVASPVGMLLGLRANRCVEELAAAGNALGVLVGRAVTLVLEAAAAILAAGAHTLALAAGVVPAYMFPLPYLTAAVLCGLTSLIGLGERSDAAAQARAHESFATERAALLAG